MSSETTKILIATGTLWVLLAISSYCGWNGGMLLVGYGGAVVAIWAWTLRKAILARQVALHQAQIQTIITQSVQKYKDRGLLVHPAPMIAKWLIADWHWQGINLTLKSLGAPPRDN